MPVMKRLGLRGIFSLLQGYSICCPYQNGSVLRNIFEKEITREICRKLSVIKRRQRVLELGSIRVRRLGSIRVVRIREVSVLESCPIREVFVLDSCPNQRGFCPNQRSACIRELSELDYVSVLENLLHAVRIGGFGMTSHTTKSLPEVR